MTDFRQLVLISAIIFLTGCGSAIKFDGQDLKIHTNHNDTETAISLIDELGWICEAFRPIELEGLESEQAPEEVGQQIAEHNAVWHVICE